MQGALSVEVEGESVDLPSGRATELLAWLAVHPGHHPRRQVASVLWPDVPDSTALASLRTALWTLRKALGPTAESLLAHDRSTVALEGPDLWVDLRERDRWSIEELITADVENVLPGVETDWADQARADHRTAVVGRLADADEGAEAEGDVETLLRVARRLAEIEPLSEAHHRLLLRRLAAAGDRGAAAEEHQRFRNRLWQELNVQPSAATVTLARRLASSTDGGVPGGVPNRLARLEGEPLVGRDDEARSLLGEWERCRTGAGARVAVVEGEAGIGKTRLLAECASRVREDGGRVLFGAASEDELLPGEPFLEAIGERRSLDPHALIDATHQAIETATAERPVALLLDDFQWADTISFAVLRRVVRVPVTNGLIVVVGHRTGSEPDPRLATLATDLARDVPVVRIALAPLPLSATRALLTQLDPGDLLHDRIETIHTDTGGNPFFIRELGRYFVERPDAVSSTTPVPDTVRGLVVSKLEGLSPSAFEAAATAAVLGSRCEQAVLRRMLRVGDVLGFLEEAVAAGLMEEAEAGLHEFRHALVRRAVYDSLSKSRRADMHRRAAEALHAVHGDAAGLHLCEIAEHRCAACPPDSPQAATAAALHASAWAVDHHAYDRAVVVLTKALRVCEPPDRQELAVRRAVAYQRLTHDVIDPITA